MPTSPVLRRLAVLAFAAGLAFGVGPAGAQVEAPDDDTTPTPGLPVPDDPELGIVHSWALTPAGAGGGSQSGDRANLTYEMAPGTLVQDKVTVFNFSNVPLTFELFPLDAANNDDGAFGPVPREADQQGVGAWVSLAVDTVEVPARQAAIVDLAVSVPADARPGDHAGVILAANTASGTGADGKVVDLNRQTGTRVYIRVDGPLDPELAVADLATHYAPELNPLDGSATVTYRVENRGNVRLAGTHRVSVGGPFGLLRQSGEWRELPELLPGQSLEFTETIDGVAATVGAFTTVDLEARSSEQLGTEIRSSDRRAIGLALPFLVIALVAVAALVWVSRARYRRHGEDPPPGDGFGGDDDLIILEPQST